MAFQLERSFALPSCAHASASVAQTSTHGGDGAVYVCGLARSGTTALLRILSELGEFRSLTYRDMPFVLAPNLWEQIVRWSKRPNRLIERVHGDGVMVDFDSPEAFEEVFWRMWQPEASGSGNCLASCELSAAALQAFAEYRTIVANPRSARGPRRRYLSKNNNNLLRLHQLCADPTATVLLMYRHPLAAAHSLFQQHRQLSRLQSHDGFVRAYMRWLGHYEFGLDHKPFCFAATQLAENLTADSADYWLAYWNAVHSHILTQRAVRFHLVCYEDLCTQPRAMLQAIFTLLGVPQDAGSAARHIRLPGAPFPQQHAAELRARALHTYEALRNCERNIRYQPFPGRRHNAWKNACP